MKLDKLRAHRDDRHWDYFAEFIEWEMNAGGPDPHLRLAGHMAADEPMEERVWRAGCYIGVYNVPTAEIIWQDWPWPDMLEADEQDVYDWFDTNWTGIATRRERKSVRIKENMVKFFKDYAEWANELPGRRWLDRNYADPCARYEEAWDDCQDSVKFLGRYVAFKLLEFGIRYCDWPIALKDIRPRGGWSPRAMLGLLFPDRDEPLMGDDSEPNLKLANESADETLHRLWDRFGLNLTHYELQVLLCDYKQSYVGRRQFPGKSQDSTLEYIHKVASWWGELDTEVYDVRARVFPHEVLGEIQGWGTSRKELGGVLRDYGYTWSDLLYDYVATDKNYAQPVERSNPVKVGSEPKVTPIVSGKVYQRGEFKDFCRLDKLWMFGEHDIDIVVCLYNHKGTGPDYEIGDSLHKYRYVPMPDGKSGEREFDNMLELATELADDIEDGHVVLSHCHGGRNRAGLMNSLIVRELYHKTGTEALEYVESVRPNAVATVPFREFLHSLPAPDVCRIL